MVSRPEHHPGFLMQRNTHMKQGVAVSHHATLAPVSLASTIIGFVSFAFTAATFVRVFWSEITSIISAPSESRDLLSALRISLVEERNYIRMARRRNSREHRMVDADLHVMHENVRDMIKQFKRLEKPFVMENHRDLEKGVRWDDFYVGGYKEMTFFQRFIWTREQGNVKELMDSLEKLQIRRITAQVWDMSCAMHYMDRNIEVLDEIDDTVYAMNEKLSRVVGVRRVDR